MMRWIVGSSVKFRLLIIPIVAVVLIVGFTQLPAMPVDVYPEFSPPTVEIQTEALGLSAAEVEQLVTVPLEQDLLNGVPWLQEITSNSVAGLSAIDLVFTAGTDVLRARQMVQERLTQAHALPHVSKPPVMIQPVSSTSRVMMVGLSSKDLSLIDMSVLARWRIKPRLMGVPGVANVAIWGQRERQLQVQVDPDRLAQSGVSLGQVIRTSGNALWVSPLTFVEASTPGTGGFIDTPNQRLSIQHVLPIRTAQDLAQVRIEETTPEKPLKLGDVAQVTEDHQPLIGDAVVNDKPGLMLVVEKFPGANTLEVTKGVEDALAALRPGLSGVTVDSSLYRPANYIEDAVGGIRTMLLIGLLLVFLLLGAFLFDWRTGLISLVAIPLSLAAAGLVLYLRGGTFNVVVLAGLVIALGAIVDDAVADVANIRRRLREHHETGDAWQAGGGDARAGSDESDGKDRSTAAVVLGASLEVRQPMLYATLVLLVAAVPAYFLTGVIGAFAQPLVLSYGLAVLAALAVALTATPALAMVLLPRTRPERREPPLVRWIQRGYTATAAPLLRRSVAAFGVIAVLLLVGAAFAPRLGGHSVLPALQDRNVLIRWDGVVGLSQPEMVRITEQATAALRAVPGVRNVGAHVGRAITSDKVVGVNSGELWVTIDPAADYEPTVARIQKVVDGYPGFAHDVRTYPERQVTAATTGSGQDLVVRVFGQDMDTLKAKAEEVRQILAHTEGVVTPRVDTPTEEPTVEIEVNLAAAQRYGLKPGDVRRDTAILISGLLVGNLFEEQKVFDVVVWGAPSARQSVASVRELLLDTPDGGHVRLKDVADVRVKPNLTDIKHDSVSRRIDVTASVSGRSVDAVAADVNTKIKGISFPLEYHAEVLGGYSERASARTLLLTLAAAAAIAIFLLLQAAFGSWRLAGLVFVTLPLALVGGVVAAVLGGGANSLGVIAGLFLVGGMAIRHAIMLIRHYQRLEHDDGETFGPDLVARGARERAAPILLTTATVAVALLPMAVLGNVPGGELLRPLAVVALGGLLTSAVLTLVVLPALYLRLGSRPGRPEPEPAVKQQPA